MAVYTNDFSQYTLNQAPDDFTSQWDNGASSLEVVEESGVRMLILSITSSGRIVWTWDEVPVSSTQKTFMQIEVSTDIVQSYIRSRVSGSSGNETSFDASINTSLSNPSQRYTRYVDGSFLQVDTNDGVKPQQGEIWNYLWELDGNTYAGYFWKDGESKPATPQLSDTDANLNTKEDGLLGIGSFGTGDYRILYLSVGTEGDDPVIPDKGDTPNIQSFTTDETSAAVKISDTEADSYEYRLDEGTEVSVGTNLLFLIPSLINATTYDLQVRAVYSGVPSNWSAVTEITTNSLTSQFEDSSGVDWTDLNNQDTFLEIIKNSDRATVEVLGQSVEGRDIPIVLIGYPSAPSWQEIRDKGSFALFAGIHGDEIAGREASFKLMRDYVYSSDNTDQQYLEDHPIVILPMYNPDGFPDTRNNANDVDLNRDMLALAQAETQAVTKSLRDGRFHIVCSSHERNASGEDIQIRGHLNNQIDQALKDESIVLQDAAISHLISEGFTSAIYSPSTGMPNAFEDNIGLRHGLCLLFETWKGDSNKNTRVNAQDVGIRFMIDYHRQNASNIATLVSNSVSNKIQEGEEGTTAFQLTGRVGDTGVILDPPPKAYKLTEAQITSFALHADRFEIDIVNEFVIQAQRSQPVNPMLLDDSSEFTIVSAERQFDNVVNVSPENEAEGVSRTPTLLFNETGEVPENRYYQINIVAIATAGTTPDWNEAIKTTQIYVPNVDNQEFTLSEQLDSDQWYAWKIVAKLMPEQAEYVETFDGNDGDPLPNDWESEVLL